MLRLLPKSSRIVGWTCVALFFTGCAAVRNIVVVDKPPPRVSVKGYPLDLAYGVQVVATPEQQQAIIEALGPELVEELDFGFTYPTFSGGSAAAFNPCPDPGQDAIVEPIGLDVKKAMAPGNYKWKQQGTFEIVGLFKLAIDQIGLRTIRNVTTPDAMGVFTYEIESTLSLRRQIQQFQVRPNDGVYLTYMKTLAGENSKEFTPVPATEIFPLPASAGLAITSVGIDPNTQEVLNVSATIKGKERYEGCGEAFDAWLADPGLWTFSRPGDAAKQPPPPPQVPWDYDYALAPQLGGMFVFDHLATTEVLGAFTIKSDINSTLANIIPTPAT